MNHLGEAKRILEFAPWSDPATALAHAVVALVEKLDELPMLALHLGGEEEEDDE